MSGAGNGGDLRLEFGDNALLIPLFGSHNEHLARIEAPTLLVDGEDSPYRQLDVAARVQAMRHATAVVVPGAGHLLHHDAPDALADVLARFLET